MNRCTTARGRAGEELAAAWLSRRGYRIVERNYRRRCGEIDIIARKDGCLVFVEVKSRQSARFGSPLEAVTRAKQIRLSRIAREYLQRHGGPDQACRFDVLAIIHRAGHPPEFELAVNAFDGMEGL